jgi:hypothetical protein
MVMGRCSDPSLDPWEATWNLEGGEVQRSFSRHDRVEGHDGGGEVESAVFSERTTAAEALRRGEIRNAA